MIYKPVISKLPIIGFQVQGSHDFKRFPDEQIRKLIMDLSKDYIVVVLDSKKYDICGKNIINLSESLELDGLFAVVGSLSAVCVYDSALLWIAHSTSTPCVCWLGPTPEKTRTTQFQPQSKMYVVNGYKHKNCKPCFYNSKACDGRKACVKELDYDWLYNETVIGIEKVLK